MENKINIGELDTLVTLYQATQTRGEQGQKKFSFTKFRDVFAKLDRDVSESVSYDNLEAGDNIVITIYKVPEMTTRWRVLIGSQYYEISSIDPVSRMSPLCRVSISAVD